MTTWKIRRLLGGLTVGSLMGLPGLAGFTGLMLLSPALLGNSTTGLLLAWSTLTLLGSVLWRTFDASRKQDPVAASPVLLPLIPAVVLLVWLGVAPAPFVSRVASAIERVALFQGRTSGLMSDHRPRHSTRQKEGVVRTWP